MLKTKKRLILLIISILAIILSGFLGIKVSAKYIFNTPDYHIGDISYTASDTQLNVNYVENYTSNVIKTKSSYKVRNNKKNKEAIKVFFNDNSKTSLSLNGVTITKPKTIGNYDFFKVDTVSDLYNITIRYKEKTTKTLQYLDNFTNEVLKTETLNVYTGDDYNITPTKIEHYDFNKSDKALTGKNAKNDTIKIYEKIKYFDIDINPDHNIYKTDYYNGARVKSYDVEIFYKNGTLLNKYTGISDYCSTNSKGEIRQLIPYNGWMVVSNIQYREGYKFNKTFISYDSSEEFKENTNPNGKLFNVSSTGFTMTQTKEGKNYIDIVTSPISYNISYNLNGGVVTGNPTTYTVETADFTLKNPTRTGYTFLGWSGSNSLTGTSLSQYTTSNPYTAKGRDHILGNDFSVTPGKTYRVFVTAKRLSGNLDMQGGIWYTAQTQGAGYDGYGGIFTKIKDLGNGYAVYYKDVTVKDGKSKGRYYIQLEQGSTTTTLTSWSLADMSAIEIETATTIPKGSTGNKSFTANFKANTYKVKFDGNGATSGTMPDLDMTYDTPKNVTTNTFTKTGYTFDGWNTAKDGTGKDYGNSQSINNLTTKNGDSITFYAKWKANSYTIKFDGNGATSGTTANLVIKYDETKPLTDNGFQKTGYTFDGWNTAKDGTGTNYTDKQSVKNLTSTNGATVTLYAKWTAQKLNIIFNKNDGSGQKNTQSLVYDGNMDDNNLSPTSTFNTRTGYTFTGWSFKSDGSDNTNYPFNNKIGEDWFLNQVKNNKETTINLYGQWTINKYRLNINVLLPNGTETYTTGEAGTIQLSLDGGKTYTGDIYNETTNCGSVNYNTDIRIRSIKPGAGMHFGSITGTGTIKDLGNGIYQMIMPASASEINVKMAYNNYTLTVNANGGTWSGTTPQTIASRSTVSIANPTRTGYTFAGWTVTGTGASITDGTFKMGSSNATLTAKWNANTYTVKFNGNGSTSGTTANQTLTYDKASNLNANGFVRTGYNFAGWNTKADGTGTNYSNKQEVKNLATTGTVNLYAKWNIVNYSITYNLNGGTDPKNPATYNINTADITLKNPTRTGYTFFGWSGSATGTTVKIAKGSTGNKTFTANWKINQYYLDVNPDEHIASFDITVNGEKSTGLTDYYQQKNYGTESIITNVKPKAGYSYSSYNVGGSLTKMNDSTNTNIHTKLGAGNGDVSLKSSIITYKITYNLNGGSVTGNPTTYTVETADFTLKNPTRTGYTFTGWSGSATGTTVKIAKGSTGDKSFTANFKANTYKVKFDGNGATSGTMPDLDMTYDTPKNVTTNTFTKTGYTFDGWNTAKDGTGKDYGNSQSINNLITKNGDSITFYAKWKANSYTIKFDGNGATSGTTANLVIKYDETKPLTDNGFQKTGYTFDGWNTKADGTGTNYTDKQSVKNLTATDGETVTLYAKWNIINYSITYNLNGGTDPKNPATYNINTADITLKNPTRTGYTFFGWSGSNSLTGTSLSQYTTSNPYTAKGRDHILGNDFSVTPGKTYRVFVTAKRLSGNLDMQGGIWYTAQTQGASYDGYGGIFTKIKDLGNGYAVYYKDVTVKDGKTKGKFYIQLDQDTSGGSTSWSLADMSAIEIETATTIPKGSTGNKSFTANFKANTYTIKFDGNTATGGATANLAMTYDTAKNLTANSFTKQGYTFAGWNTAKDGTGTNYTDKQSVKNLTATNGVTITLYAKWTPNSVKVTFNGNSGTIAKNGTQTFTSGKGQKFADTGVTRKGYTLLGWADSKTATTKQYDILSGVTDGWIGNGGTRTLYAVWKLNTYKITYNLNGGVVTGNPTTYTVETSDFTLKNPTRTGYTFTGWSGSATGTTVKIAKGSTGDKSFTANWKEVPKYAVDVNPVIQNEQCNSGKDGFTFDVYENGVKVSENVIDYYSNNISKGTEIRVVVHPRNGYNILYWTDAKWTVTDNLELKPTWWDNIAPTTDNGGFFRVTECHRYWWVSKNMWATNGASDYRVVAYVYDGGTGIDFSGGSGGMYMNSTANQYWHKMGDSFTYSSSIGNGISHSPMFAKDCGNGWFKFWTVFTCTGPNKTVTFKMDIKDRAGNNRHLEFNYNTWWSPTDENIGTEGSIRSERGNDGCGAKFNPWSEEEDEEENNIEFFAKNTNITLENETKEENTISENIIKNENTNTLENTTSSKNITLEEKDNKVKDNNNTSKDNKVNEESINSSKAKVNNFEASENLASDDKSSEKENK